MRILATFAIAFALASLIASPASAGLFESACVREFGQPIVVDGRIHLGRSYRTPIRAGLIYEGDYHVTIEIKSNRLEVSTDWTWNLSGKRSYTLFQTGIGVMAAKNGSVYSCARRPDLCQQWAVRARELVQMALDHSAVSGMRSPFECALEMVDEFDRASAQFQ